MDTTDPGQINIRSRQSSGDGLDTLALASPSTPPKSELFHSAPVDRPIFGQAPGNVVEQAPEVDAPELMDMLQQTESLGEQAEIIHYLFLTKCVPNNKGHDGLEFVSHK